MPRFCHWKRFSCSMLTAMLLGIACLTVPSTAALAERPNIILIMSDDMGYSDIGCYGSEIDTPVLDGLADKGIRFTQFYNTARCCPTRACLLTGLYPHQAGVGHMMNDRGLEGYQGDLTRNCVTIAEVLRGAGYRNYLSGKWHVTKHTAPEGPKFNWPLQRGFDRFYGTIHGAGSFYDPNSLTRGNTQISPYADPEYRVEQYYYTDAISDQASRFIREHHQEAGERPFFMYVSYTCAHWPMHALEKDIAKYRGKYDEGYEPIRRARFEKMKRLGLIAPDAELSPQAGDWNKVEDQEWESACMEVYAAMIDNMDRGIGRIVEALQETGKYEETLICFYQDNGGCAEGLGRHFRKGFAKEYQKEPNLPPMADDELQFSMIPEKTRDGRQTALGPGVPPGPDGTYIAYGRGWANVSNTPFREYKHWVHEGGISTPLIVHWPEGIPSSRHGSLYREPSHLIDLMATCVDLAEADYPETYRGQPIKSPEGVSLRPALRGMSLERENPLFWEHEGNRAIRQGEWKLVAKGALGPWELYNLEKDRGELHDLAEEMPQRVEKMAAAWEAWAKRANAKPWPYKTKK